MITELAILLEGRLAAWIRLNRERVTLTYEETWCHASDSFPLSLSMPLLAARHGHNALDPYLWGLLPDNGTVLKGWLNRFDIPIHESFSFSLLAHVGEDCAGAVQVIRPERIEACLSARAEPPRRLKPGDVAARLQLLRFKPSAWRTPDDQGQFCLTGAQPKIALLHQNGRWHVPSGRTPTTHILKPSLADYPGHAENEHFCAVLARRLGLSVMNSEVMGFGEETAIVVERYDRHRTRHEIRRVHQEDMCQALSLNPVLKYQNDGGPGIQDIFKLLHTHSTEPEEDEASFLDAIAFNWIIGGTDAHAKNYSLLIGAEGEVRLAPLYDIASALPYDNLDIRELRLAMEIGRHYRMHDVSGRQWEKLAEDIHVEPEALLQRVAEMAAQVPDEAESTRRRLTEEGLRHPIIDKLHDRIVARAATCARSMEGILGRD